jgi:integrase
LKSYSLQKHHGNWVTRWSVYEIVDGKRKRTQPTHIIASIRNYKKKSDVKPLADAYFQERLQKSRTVQAGASLTDFVTNVFFPHNESRLSKNTTALYRQQWKRLEPHLGSIRLRDVMTPHIQSALDSIHNERKEEISHDCYMHIKVTASAIFSLAIRRRDHPGPNPENQTTVRSYGHKQHRVNGAYDLNEIKQFFHFFPSGDIAVAIAVNAFLALRKPEIEALRPEDFDPVTNLVRIHRNTKTRNDEKLPVIGPLRKIMAAGDWNQINLRIAERAIVKTLKGTTLQWKGWYGFRRGMLTNLWKLGVPVEEAAMILRNSPEVCRRHYLRLDETASKQSAMDTLEKTYLEERINIQ